MRIPGVTGARVWLVRSLYGALFLVGLALFCQPSRAQPPETDLAKLVSWTLKNGYGHHRLVVPFYIAYGGKYTKVTIALSDSRDTDEVVYRDNCVASPTEAIVDCDLKLIDDLIHAFYIDLVDLDGLHGEKRTTALQAYRSDLLLWVLAHEIGHVVLRHGISDFQYTDDGTTLVDEVQQKKELEADAYAITVIGKLGSAPWAPYLTLENVINILVQKSVCPETFPKVCSRMPAGVGLIYDYTGKSKPIEIPIGTSHPAFLARFLRISLFGWRRYA